MDGFVHPFLIDSLIKEHYIFTISIDINVKPLTTLIYKNKKQKQPLIVVLLHKFKIKIHEVN